MKRCTRNVREEDGKRESECKTMEACRDGETWEKVKESTCEGKKKKASLPVMCLKVCEIERGA